MTWTKQQIKTLEERLPNRMKPITISNDQYLEWNIFKTSTSLRLLSQSESEREYVIDKYNEIFNKKLKPVEDTKKIIKMIDKLDIVFNTYKN